MDLQIHLKNFTVKELRQEVLNVKRDFAVSQLKRADVERVILANSMFSSTCFGKKKQKNEPLLRKKQLSPPLHQLLLRKKQLLQSLHRLRLLHLN